MPKSIWLFEQAKENETGVLICSRKNANADSHQSIRLWNMTGVASYVVVRIRKESALRERQGKSSESEALWDVEEPKVLRAKVR